MLSIDTIVTAVLGVSGIIATFLISRWHYKQEERARTREQALISLKAHYKTIIQRMEKWNYSCEMIYLVPESATLAGGFESNRIAPSNLNNDLMHLKEFRRTWELYANGPGISRDFNTKQQAATNLVKSKLQKMIQERGVSFPNWETDELLKTFTSDLISNVQMELRDGKSSPVTATIPRDWTPGYFSIWSHNLMSNQSNAEEFTEIIDVVRRLPDVKEKVKEMYNAVDKKNEHEQSFTTSLRNDVIEPAKNSIYTDARLFGGECEDCKHLKELAS